MLSGDNSDEQGYQLVESEKEKVETSRVKNFLQKKIFPNLELSSGGKWN